MFHLNIWWKNVQTRYKDLLWFNGYIHFTCVECYRIDFRQKVNAHYVWYLHFHLDQIKDILELVLPSFHTKRTPLGRYSKDPIRVICPGCVDFFTTYCYFDHRLLQLAWPSHCIWKCLYQTRKVGGNVFVCYWYQYCLFLSFCYWIPELFLQCSIFLEFFYFSPIL